ncbi:hypothetical protein BUALT_Bualt19G0046600 [Buddleja alternifolia]|uniref:SWIM-type domain-containing protein n=1 Tax=Buddleja alternifolia TaxID=168488 RepID=A0AAV6W9L9_9LAMI|nr:hypothetical protein BUALT_Bualt19G0046600 [Buddleja alternifolia]
MTATYEGGRLSIFDYVDINFVSIDFVDRLCEKLGYMGLKRYFWLDSMTFKQLMNGDDIVKLCLDHYADRVVDIYVEAMSDLIDSQVGSSHLNESETSESEQGSDFTDSDYDMETGDEGGLEDDNAFEKHVDRGVEWEGIDEGNQSRGQYNDEGIGSDGEPAIVKTDPKRNIKGFREDAVMAIRCNISRFQAYRTKMKALKTIEGNHENQYAKLWDYAAELRRTNPGSTVVMNLADDDSGNLRAEFKGLAYKRLLWKAAMSTTVPDFESTMKEIGRLDKNALKWLSDKSPNHWSRSHFNPNILDAREKPILVMLEMIREWMMTRLQVNRDRAKQKWHSKVCPKIRTIMAKNIELAADCVPIKSNEFHYEVGTWLGSSKYTVDLGKHICSCRKWDLSGIPCQHAMSAICSQVKDPEDYVHEYYWVDTYHKVYEHAMYPINGSSLWKETGLPGPKPPNEGRAAGRPPSARRMEPGEPAKKQKKKAPWHGTRLKRQQSTIRCRVCGEKGHNSKAHRKQSTGVPNEEGGLGDSIYETSGAANDPLHEEQRSAHDQGDQGESINEDIDMADAPISQPQSDPQ